MSRQHFLSSEHHPDVRCCSVFEGPKCKKKTPWSRFLRLLTENVFASWGFLKAEVPHYSREVLDGGTDQDLIHLVGLLCAEFCSSVFRPSLRGRVEAKDQAAVTCPRAQSVLGVPVRGGPMQGPHSLIPSVTPACIRSAYKQSEHDKDL